MYFSQAATALCAATIACASPVMKRQNPSGYAWGQETVRGVNIGGWLILEPFITPSIFEAYHTDLQIIDEYSLCDVLHDGAYDVLRPHWDTWAQFSDFQKIAASGFNLVRIPIGYWAYDNSGTPYKSGAAPYMDAAISWARQLGLKVIIDLHGAPGSQNGYDNSGQRLSEPLWFTQPGAVQKTLDVLQTIQNKYATSDYDDVVAGIELLNEPLSTDENLAEIMQFERNGYGQQRTVSESRVVIIQDGFKRPSTYDGWLTPSDANCQNVAIDHHAYHVFTDELVAMQPWQHRQYVCNNAYSYIGADKWTIVGEWTAAMTDCAAYVNGYILGARYDGSFPGSSYVGTCTNINAMDTWTQQFRDDTRGFIEAQMEVYEQGTQGWIFWNFKTQNSPEWDAFQLIDAGIFPQPLSDRKFGQICDNNI